MTYTRHYLPVTNPIEDLDLIFAEHKIDDVLHPFIKKQLKILLLIHIALCAALFLDLSPFNIAYFTILLSMASGLCVFIKLLATLKAREIDRYAFFSDIFPMRVILPFDLFFLKKDQTAMVYIGWLFWFTVCVRELHGLNIYWFLLANYLALYLGAFCTFLLIAHPYYFFAVKKLR